MKKMIAIILIGMLLVCFWNPPISVAKAACNDWWDTDWEFRKEIRINHEMVANDLENFPILFHNVSNNFTAHAQSDGDDFVFISSDGTIKYNHEIEYYSRKTGELIAWVNITSLSSTVDTIFYIYYGNPSCSNQENGVGAWDSNYVGVWHCNNEVDNDEGDILDSTINYNHGTTQNMESEDLVDGKIAGGLNFGGTNEKVLVYDSQYGSLDITDYITLECWWNASDLSKSYNTLIGKSMLVGNWQYEYRLRDTTEIENRYSLLTSGGLHDDNETHEIEKWYYATVTLDPSDIIFYDNGEISTVQDSTEVRTTNAQFGFGAAGDYGNYFEGIIDEVRVSKVNRSACWIETSYNTMNNPSIFLSVGIEESKPADNIPPNPPEITGPKKGKPGILYDYTFSTEDSEGDDVSYYIEWGDGTSAGWSDYYKSGTPLIINHTWNKMDYYDIRCKAKDIDGAESNWSTYQIEIPKNKVTIFNFHFLKWFFEGFPVLERFLHILNTLYR